ncbi:uncharacterized protein B0P05DRAFT_636930 [Gilbertella persicaria]|uniref:uncharacterized protein n=1 Tax=Gilbertella persicaria TaxID=101096 RepID=UPI00221ECE3C|nr:uncharacterized protein B0P05DRAFT_636930 [Gilbertella persicaria]KAI8080708.1 hypothetical protein B0P05DRAFT_636930 [Gilbertella persicaria]
MTPSSPISPSPLPPRRPNKSKLRTLSTTNHASSTNSSNSSLNSTDMLTESPVEQRPIYTSRFKEHFDDISTQQIDLISDIVLPPKPSAKRPSALTLSKSTTSVISPLSSPSFSNIKMPRMTRASASTTQLLTLKDELDLPPDHLFTTTTKRVPMGASLSTPHASSQHVSSRKFGSNGSVLSINTNSFKSNHSNHSRSTLSISYNRADILITRLEGWYQFLKSVTNWIQDVSKISLQSSRGFFQRAYPHLDGSAAFTTTTTTTTTASPQVTQNVNQAILTVQAGFQVLTMQIAAGQQEFSKCLERDHLAALMKLRKEVKEKIQTLRNDPALAMDELLRRAEVTRSKMMYLNQCCKQADKTKGPIEMDPWLANMLVLRQLKREIDEENRLRLLMIPIQQDVKAFETRLINTVKPAIRYCYQKLAPGAWDGSADKDTTPFRHLLEKIVPDHEWEQFVKAHKKELVDEKQPSKNYLRINYPNKLHPSVMTLWKGKMERKFGVRKQFTERTFVLSQGGYLHQFSLDNKVMPEKTFYIPTCTVIPSIDINSFQGKKSVFAEYGLHDTSNTFEICRPANNVLQRDKISVFRTSTREELITWCRMLIHIASGLNISSLNTQTASTDDSLLLDSDTKSSITKSDSSTTKEYTYTSPARSFKSSMTEESFSDLIVPNKIHYEIIPESLAQSAVIEEEEEEKEEMHTDAESFVTAQFDRLNFYHSDSDEHNEAVNDYFLHQKSQQGILDDADAISIASTSTAKGPSAANSAVNRSPSLASTQFDDAQSSLYFSSASVPPSPSLSSQSSVVSIPDFHLIPEASHTPRDDTSLISLA